MAEFLIRVDYIKSCVVLTFWGIVESLGLDSTWIVSQEGMFLQQLIYSISIAQSTKTLSHFIPKIS